MKYLLFFVFCFSDILLEAQPMYILFVSGKNDEILGPRIEYRIYSKSEILDTKSYYIILLESESGKVDTINQKAQPNLNYIYKHDNTGRYKVIFHLKHSKEYISIQDKYFPKIINDFKYVIIPKIDSKISVTYTVQKDTIKYWVSFYNVPNYNSLSFDINFNNKRLKYISSNLLDNHFQFYNDVYEEQELIRVYGSNYDESKIGSRDSFKLGFLFKINNVLPSNSFYVKNISCFDLNEFYSFTNNKTNNFNIKDDIMFDDKSLYISQCKNTLILKNENNINSYKILYKCVNDAINKGEIFLKPNQYYMINTDLNCLSFEIRCFLKNKLIKIDTIKVLPNNQELKLLVAQKRDNECEENPSGSLALSAKGGFPPYMFKINQITVGKLLNLKKGKYYTSVIDSLRCEVSDSTNILDFGPIAKYKIINYPTSNKSFDGAIQTAAVSNYSYWIGDGIFKGNIVRNIGAEKSILVVVNSWGCFDTAQVQLNIKKEKKDLLNSKIEPFEDTIIDISNNFRLYIKKHENDTVFCELQIKDILNLSNSIFFLKINPFDLKYLTSQFFNSRLSKININEYISDNLTTRGYLLFNFSNLVKRLGLNTTQNIVHFDTISLSFLKLNSVNSKSITINSVNPNTNTVFLTGSLFENFKSSINYIQCGEKLYVKSINNKIPFDIHISKEDLSGLSKIIKVEENEKMIELYSGHFKELKVSAIKNSVEFQSNILKYDSTKINPSIRFLEISDNLCEKNNGSLAVIGENSYPPYNYLWSNGVTHNKISNLKEGKYFISVIDSRGCIVSDSMNIYSIYPQVFPNILKFPSNDLVNNGQIKLNFNTFIKSIKWNGAGEIENELIKNMNINGGKIVLEDFNGCEKAYDINFNTKN